MTPNKALIRAGALLVGLWWATDAGAAEDPGAPAATSELAKPVEPVEPAEPTESTQIGHAATVSLRASALGYGAQVGYRARFRRGVGLGLEVEGLYDPEAVLGGYATEHNGFVNARVPVFIPAVRSSALTMAVLVAPGVRFARSVDPGYGPDQSLAVTLEPGVFAYLHATPRLTWMLGVTMPVAIQVDPITDVAELGTLVATGPVVTLGRHVNLFATVDTGGLFGSDGDAGKFLIRGTAGVRIHWGVGAADWTAY
ncbi:MAG: hypothetical protein AAGF11_30030 [Myxococcota bacterium]